MKKNVHVIVSGKVQGVWYRASTKQKAEQLGITGWVKNKIDGCVEALFQGDEKQLDMMINWCYQGPALAKVKDVKIKTINSDEIFEEFTIKH